MENVSFDLIYRQYYHKAEKLSKAFSKTTGIDEDEFKSYLNEEFFLAVRDFDHSKSTNLSKWLNHRLRARLIDLLRCKYILDVNKWVFYESGNKSNNDDEQESYNIYEPISETNIEEEYIRKITKKTNADKRQLISELVKDTDSVTTAIVNEYLNWTSSERLTPTAIGRKLGIHHEIVKRKLNKLAKRYDERQFGSIDAYLAV